MLVPAVLILMRIQWRYPTSLCLAFALWPAQIGAQQISRGLGEWRTLTTPHFQIHFTGEREDFALRVGTIAERVHAQLEPLYQSGAEETHVALIFETDTVNAFATPYGLDQIVLFMDSPRAGEFARYDLWVELLFTHEYTHILSLRIWDRDHPTLTSLRVLLGVPPNLISPGGMIEGTAVWQESQDGLGRLEDPLTHMVVRTMVLSESYPSPAEVLNGSHRWPGYTMAYLFGGRFVNTLTELAGEDAIYDYWFADAAPMIPDTRLPPAQNVLRLYAAMRQADEQHFGTQLEQLREQGVTPFERLTDDGYVKRFLIHDGERLFFFADPAAHWPGLYSLGDDGVVQGERRQLSSGGIARAGGREIYSEDYLMFADFGLRHELYDADALLFERLTPGRHVSFPSLNASGDRIVFVERDDRFRYLVVADLTDGGLANERRLIRVPFTGMLQYTAMTRDGRRVVALVRRTETGRGRFVLCELGPEPACRTLLAGPGVRAQPRFSRDEQAILFSSDVDGIYNLYALSLADSSVQRLTRTLTGLFYPAPASDFLYAIGYFENGYDIVRLRYEDLLGESVQLFEAPSEEPAEESEETPDNEWLLPAQPDPEDSYFIETEDTDTLLPGDQELPEGWAFSDYSGAFAIRPFFLGLIGPVTVLNVGVAGRDPLNRHNFLFAIGPSVPKAVAAGYYDYTRFPIGLGLVYATNYFKTDRAPGCLSDEDPLRFTCDDKYTFFEQAGAYLRFINPGRYVSTQGLLGYSHQKIRNARRLRSVEYDARDLNLSGPSLVFLAGATEYFSRSISPEKGFRFSFSTDYYTSPESKDRLTINGDHAVEYGVAEGGLALYLPSFWDYHVNYLSAYGYGSYGPDRELQKVRLHRFVRGQDYARAPSDHSAFVFTYEYRLPLLNYSDSIIDRITGFTLRDIGLGVFYDYGTVFDRVMYREGFAGAYGASMLFDLNVAYLALPQMRLSVARGTGPAGELQFTFAFSAEFSPEVVQDRSHSSPITTPYRRSLPGRESSPGYFRDRAAGGILE
ncbi:MAG: hypothetical protein H7A21_19260 [Spirochaetales bacterium]|nr:hypothetical protein [Leptospiraceae bacterium]MCP5483585.1 hypothetical protein [Spirochaetales bacterium]